MHPSPKSKKVCVIRYTAREALRDCAVLATYMVVSACLITPVLIVVAMMLKVLKYFIFL